MESLFETLVREHGVEVAVVAPHEKDLAKTERSKGIDIHRFQYAWPASRQRVAYGGGIPDNIAGSKLAKAQCIPFALRFLLSAFKHARGCDIIHANWVEPAILGLLVNG